MDSRRTETLTRDINSQPNVRYHPLYHHQEKHVDRRVERAAHLPVPVCVIERGNHFNIFLWAPTRDKMSCTSSFTVSEAERIVHAVVHIIIAASEHEGHDHCWGTVTGKVLAIMEHIALRAHNWIWKNDTLNSCMSFTFATVEGLRACACVALKICDM